MKPVFIVNGHDYTRYLAEDGLSPAREDLDADGSGRNLLDGFMYRARITKKHKWTVKFNRLTEDVEKRLAEDVDEEYTDITLLHPKLNRIVTQTYYISTLTYGAQKYSRGDGCTVYDGCTFNITER